MRHLFSAIHAVTGMVAKEPNTSEAERGVSRTDIDIGTITHGLIGMDSGDVLKVTTYYRYVDNKEVRMEAVEMVHMNKDNKVLENVPIHGWGFNKSWSLVRR